jgi:hypothetical protein
LVIDKANTFEFRVSDSMVVPLRGQLLRLRVTRGNPQVGAVAVGRRLMVAAPDGREREVHILDHSMTGGRVTQARLDKTRELDLLLAEGDARIDGEPIGIGWTVRGPRE